MRDDGETIGLFEPLMVSEGSPERAGLNDLALELATISASFKSSLPESIASALADLIRSMNCYYSNLIEGHNTQAMRRIAMNMQDWATKLDGFLSLNDRKILSHAGKVSAKLAKEIAEKEYDSFHKKRLEADTNSADDFEKTVAQIENLNKDKNGKKS